MEQGQAMYTIGLGSREDRRRGRDTHYYIKSKTGERVMLVFSDRHKAQHYIDNTLSQPQAHMDLLEGSTRQDVPALTAGKLTVRKMSSAKIAAAAAAMRIDYLIRDVRPGHEQEILHLSQG